MQRFRQMLEGAISVLGVLVIFSGVILVPSDRLQLQLVVVLAGVLALEAGVWGLARPILPSGRQFTQLRKEGNHFMELMRELNAAAVERDQGAEAADAQVQDVVALMQDSVQHMAQVAGKVDS